ncbi:M48 family metallopeptidase [Actinomadura sp. NEAU-AAG7]|uniref:M48 family metallopeptidase n=1 Tax=Actinomadura sp. NEAU-AAG7 TaxID=2839640 RepID=UPI001BE45C2F|nr:M48 family metallopeptidase [Actinomadura sp. NEAU-AAG7]MBT2209883.1 M48 family metallopeptidase [Actinomadura sp. NEAU-AAG7]
MKTSLRAAVAVALLAGYYLLTLAVFAVAGLALHLMVRAPGLATVKIGVGMLVVSVPLLGALVKASRHRPEPPGGLPAGRAEEPALWAAIDELAGRIGTRPPDEVRFVPDVNAAVSEETRWFGLAARRRYMIVGVPLVEALTVAQLRAVLGHELGHYGGRHTRLGGITYRGSVALERTLGALEGGGGLSAVLGKVFTGYAKVYFRVSQAVRRSQEIEADRFMVELSGREAAAAALRSVRVTAAAWAFFLNRLAAPGARYGLVPADLLGGFRAVLAEPVRLAELGQVLDEPEERDPYDSHPTLAERLRAIAACPEPDGLVPDARPATALLTDPAALGERLGAAMFGADATALGWDDLAARTARLQADEAALDLLTAAERTGGTSPAALGTVLADLERGAGPALGRELSGGTRERPEALVGHLRALVTSALLASGRVAARLSWSGEPVALTGPDGTVIDLVAVVPDVFGPAHVPALRDWLTGWGADPAHRPEAPGRASVDLVGVLYGVEEDGDFYDALVLDVGVLFVRISAAEAMRGGMSTLPVRERIGRLLDSTPAELLGRDGSWLLDRDAVVQATFWARKDQWAVRFLVRRTEDDGTVHEGRLRVGGKPPCTDLAEAQRALRVLFGSRVQWSEAKV